MLLVDDNNIKMAMKSGKIYLKENPVRFTEESKRWRENIWEGLREGRALNPSVLYYCDISGSIQVERNQTILKYNGIFTNF